MESENKPAVESSSKNLDVQSDILAFFKNDADFVFAYKKTEKLVAAIYMVTNLFSDSEPMKWTLRTKSSELLSLMTNYKDILNAQQSDFLNAVKTKVLEIVSLLEIAALSGLVSNMNFSILKQEFANLTSILSTTRTALEAGSHNKIFSKTFFDVARPKIQQGERPQNLDEGVNAVRDTANVKDNGEKKRSNRQNIILGLLKKKGDLTIKDISLVIKDCSEKTIQRELISFMKMGVIKRVGERRWSKYSLV